MRNRRRERRAGNRRGQGEHKKEENVSGAKEEEAEAEND